MANFLKSYPLRYQMYALAVISTFCFMIITIMLWTNIPADSEMRSTLINVTIFEAGAMGLVLFMAYSSGAFVKNRAQEIVDVMAAMAKGDLTKVSEMTGNDEFAWMSAEYNNARIGFADVVKRVISGSSHLSSAADELSSITSQGSQGIARQQSEIQQVATAMEEMSATVQEVSKNAASAATAAQEADEQSKNGFKVVKETLDTIHSLADEVQRTSDVIERLKGDCISIGTVLDVIRDIAEQTNLLALNAAIEAARAGEQGRGFAVVADEVRTLASRTQQSTREIHEMIERLQTGSNEAVSAMEKGRDKASASVEQAAKAGEALEAITSVVDRIKSMNMQIAGAAEEQSSTTEEVNRNIVSISDVAEESATAAEKTANSSDDLARLALELQQQVGQFHIAS